MSSDHLNPDDLVFEIDGVEPDEIDALASLALVSALLGLVVGVGEALDVDVRMSGIRIINKCTAFAFRAQDVEGARQALEHTIRLMNRPEPPRGLRAPVEEVRRALQALPETYQTTVHVAGFRANLHETSPTKQMMPLSYEVFRAIPVRAGGTRPAVRFTSATEREPFTLLATNELARKLGAALYVEVEIEAQIVRTVEGGIESGTVLSMTTLSDDDPLATWTRWYEAMGSPYADVLDLEEALGRD